VRPRPDFQSERAFWAAPGAVDATVPILALPEVHIADVSIPMVTYTLKSKKRSAPKDKQLTKAPKGKRKEKRKRKPTSDVSSSSSSSSSEEESEHSEEEKKSVTGERPPDAWGCKLADAVVGAFAILEVEYNKGLKGISLIQVAFFCLPAGTLCLPACHWHFFFCLPATGNFFAKSYFFC
jgi:hypothetical protein